MDEEKLKKELESEGEEFFKEVDELRHEDPGAEDKEDLEQEFKVRYCCCGCGFRGQAHLGLTCGRRLRRSRRIFSTRRRS